MPKARFIEHGGDCREVLAGAQAENHTGSRWQVVGGMWERWDSAPGPICKIQIPNSKSRIPIAGTRTAKGWKAKDFKREFNNIVKGDPRFKELK